MDNKEKAKVMTEKVVELREEYRRINDLLMEHKALLISEQLL
jgi:hypothetical protein